MLEQLLISNTSLLAPLLETTIHGRVLGGTEGASPEPACQQAQHEDPLLIVLLAAAEEQLLQQGDVLQ